jgi:hypothetical protein
MELKNSKSKRKIMKLLHNMYFIGKNLGSWKLQL